MEKSCIAYGSLVFKGPKANPDMLERLLKRYPGRVYVTLDDHADVVIVVEPAHE